MKKISSIRNSALLVGGQGVAQVASAFTFVILARSLGPEAFGTLASLYGGAMFLAICIEFGATNYLIRCLNQGDALLFPGQHRSRLLMTALALLIAAALSLGLHQAQDYLLGIIMAFVLAQSRYLSAPLRANLQIGVVALLAALEKIAVLLIVAACTVVGSLNTAVFFITCSVVGIVFCVLYRLFWSSQHVELMKDSKARRFVSPFSGMRNMGISSLAVGLQALDTAVIASTAGSAAAGVYAAVGRWTQPLSLVSQAVTQSAFAEMTRGKLHSEAFSSLKTHFKMLAVAAVPLVVVFVFADVLTSWLLGAEYSDSTPVLRILVCAVLFGIVNSPLSAFLQARSDEGFTSKILLLAMPTQLALMGLLALWHGPALGALAVVVTQSALAFIFAFRVRRLNRLVPAR